MIGQQILEIVAMTPDCREEHIYNCVYVDEHETHASIAALLAIGDIIGTGAAGQTAYHLSDKFKASDAYRRIAMRVDIERAIVPGLPSVARAIEFVRSRGTATSSELHVLMELSPEQMVSHQLADALQDGRLIKDGKHWTIGVGPAEVKVPAPTIPTFIPPQGDGNVVSINWPRTTKTGGPVKLSTAELLAMINRRSQDATEVASVSSGPAPVVRCSLWSDGAVEVQRDGKTTAVLFAEEMVYLADFWARVSTSAKEA